MDEFNNAIHRRCVRVRQVLPSTEVMENVIHLFKERSVTVGIVVLRDIFLQTETICLVDFRNNAPIFIRMRTLSRLIVKLCQLRYQLLAFVV